MRSMTYEWVVALVTDAEVITGDGPLPMAIFELLEYIVNEVKAA
jgi:hypothetical protein